MRTEDEYNRLKYILGHLEQSRLLAMVSAADYEVEKRFTALSAMNQLIGKIAYIEDNVKEMISAVLDPATDFTP